MAEQIPRNDLIVGRTYVGRGRNGNVGLWNGKHFLVIGEKFGDVIKYEPYYEEVTGCFQPFAIVDEGAMVEPFGKAGWDKHYGRRMEFGTGDSDTDLLNSRRTMAARYRFRLMFEWGGGCLWCDNEASREQFDVGPSEGILPLAAETRRRLEELTAWHDQSRNWEYPPDPGPWSPDEFSNFDAAALEILERIQSELGPEFEVNYHPL